MPFGLIDATLRSSSDPNELVERPERTRRATRTNSSSDPNEVADRLIAFAVEHGGPDNVTVVVAEVRG